MPEWSDEEIQTLLALRDQGLSLQEIAQRLGRQYHAVRLKLSRLKMPSSKRSSPRLTQSSWHSAADYTSTLGFVLNDQQEAAHRVSNGRGRDGQDIYTTALTVLRRAHIPLPIPELAAALKLSEKETRDVLEYLKSQGFLISSSDGFVELLRGVPPGERIKVRIDDYCGGTWKRIGFVTDTHLGSKYAREDVLHALYDIFAKEGIRLVLHAGNIIDGYLKKINHFDLLPGLTGYTAQVEYLIERYPRQKGIETWFITGDDHEGWWIKENGLNIGEYIILKAHQKNRTDLKFVGHLEADLEFPAPRGRGWLKLMHPGGGTAYATSYSLQKIVESLQGGEKPHIILAGHYHKFNHDFPREVHVVQGGCVQDQTPFMRKKKLQAHVGGSIIEFHQAPTGEINRFRVEWINFYDKSFYKKEGRFIAW